jgi:DNA polymerase
MVPENGRTSKQPPLATFLAGEFRALWEEHGMEEDALRSPHLAKWIGSRLSAPAPLAAVSPVPRTTETTLESLEEELTRKVATLGKKTVFGAGNPAAKLLFVGEGPGPEEERQGKPFAGKAGELLERIIEAMGFRPADVYLTTVLKSQAPEDRSYTPTEIAESLPLLKAQIALVSPRVVVALGSLAASATTGRSTSLSLLRGRWHHLSWSRATHVMPTFHPAYLIRNPAAKKDVWEDMKGVMARLAEMDQ